MSEAASNQAQERANAQVSAGASGGQTLERLCDSARWMFEAKCAALLLRQRGVDRVIASVGLEPRFRNLEWTVDFVGYDFGDRILLADARQSEAVQSRLRLLGLERVGFFLCAPVDVGPDHKLSLIVADPSPGKEPDAHKLQLLDELIDLMRSEFLDLAPLLYNHEARVNAATRLVEAQRYVAMSDDPSALLDEDLRFACINEAFARYIGCTVDSLIGKQPKDIPAFSMADSVEALCRRALETKLSPPDFEIVSTRRSGARRILHVSVSPFSPIDATGHFLFVRTREVSDFVMREDMLAHRMSEATGARPRPEPTLAFLLETLIERRSIRARKNVHYLTLRSWRASIRDWQIMALKALKARIPPAMPQATAREICAETQALMGVSVFRAVVPIACGHSAETSCLSLEIARAVGARIGAPVVQAFAFQKLKGSSHPKENVRRPKLKLINPVSGPVLLVDDVSTSGAHIEEAVELLRPHANMVFAVAWISGDVV